MVGWGEFPSRLPGDRVMFDVKADRAIDVERIR